MTAEEYVVERLVKTEDLLDVAVEKNKEMGNRIVALEVKIKKVADLFEQASTKDGYTCHVWEEYNPEGYSLIASIRGELNDNISG